MVIDYTDEKNNLIKDIPIKPTLKIPKKDGN